ncbi:competence protein [Lonepinella sp. BR2357]|uniref:competence protein n=1 Tax=Lonepinella sp. BR2357 TaxID=3434549 RepID=UPI003F6E2540
MPWTILNNPDNLWGKWLKLSPLKQLSGLLLLGGTMLYWPLFQGGSHYYLLHQSEQTNRQIQQDMVTKQQQLQQVKQQLEQHLLTPELANQLAPINQAIQQLSGPLQLENPQWIFNQKPQLSLHIQGYFQDLQQFITALLAQYPRLHVVSLQIQQADQTDSSIESDVIFQLTLASQGTPAENPQ